MKWVFGYNAFRMEIDKMYLWVKYSFWMGINVNKCFDENHFERFPFYTILEKNKFIPLALKVYTLESTE